MKFFLITMLAFYLLSLALGPEYVRFSVGVEIRPGEDEKDTDVKSEVSVPSGASDLKSETSRLSPRFANETDFFCCLVEAYRLSVLTLNETCYSVLTDETKKREAFCGEGNYHRDASYALHLSELVKKCYSRPGIDAEVKNMLQPEVQEVTNTMKDILKTAQQIKISHISSEEVRVMFLTDLDFIQSKTENVTTDELSSDTSSEDEDDQDQGTNLNVDDGDDEGSNFPSPSPSPVQDTNVSLSSHQTDIINYILSLFF